MSILRRASYWLMSTVINCRTYGHSPRKKSCKRKKSPKTARNDRFHVRLGGNDSGHFMRFSTHARGSQLCRDTPRVRPCRLTAGIHVADGLVKVHRLGRVVFF